MAVPQVNGPRQRTFRPAPHVKRRGVVYCVLTRPVDANGAPIPGAAPEVGYIGQSRQTAWQREQQHRASQPFSDLIVGGAFVLEEGQWDDATLDAREQWWIRHGASVVPGGPRQRPRYNYDHNLTNPARIEIFRAQQHRRTREPGWTQQRNRVPRQRAPHRVRPIVRQPSQARSSLRRWCCVGVRCSRRGRPCGWPCSPACGWRRERRGPAGWVRVMRLWPRPSPRSVCCGCAVTGVSQSVADVDAGNASQSPYRRQYQVRDDRR
ncbi:hypothetical protein [Salinispora arenicola]|uniref:hypothetical protein n=1 Tax=Salinispora arenicola TaxID=168697 RepID=UPI0027DCEB1A|nr:hypothetical protein [Salinispora arenicola]